MEKFQNLNSDYGYFNFLINNGSNDFIEASLDEQRQTPALLKMEDWQIAVVRFKIPSVAVPLLIFEDDAYTVSLSLGNLNTDVLSNNLTYEATNTFNSYPANRYIFYYKQFLNIINTSLLLIWTTALGTPAYNAILTPYGFTAIDVPRFILDEQTNYIYLELPANNAINPPSPFFPVEPNGINLLMNSKLFYFFSGFPAFFYGQNGANNNPILNYSLSLNPSQLNSVTLPDFNPAYEPTRLVNRIRQDYSSLFLWQTLTRLVITTTMPIEQELISVRDRNGQNLTQTLLTDFEIPPSDGKLRDYIFFFPQGDIRYQNFSSNGVLSKMNLRIYFQTKDLQIFPLIIPPSFEVSIKLQFKRRKAKTLLQYGAVGSQQYF